MAVTYGNVNNMNFNQIATLLTSLYEQASGQKAIEVSDESEFVSVAQNALLCGYDALTGQISQMLSKTIFSMRPYRGKFTGIRVDNLRYGNHVRKLQALDMDIEEDERMSITNGGSFGVYDINLPEVVQTNYYGQNIYQRSMTIYKDQLDTAFSGSSQFAGFLAMVMQNGADMMTQVGETRARLTLLNLIAATLDIGNSAQCINVLDEYNKFTGLTLTVSNINTPDNYPNFVRWLYSFVQKISDKLEERTSVYHSKISLTDRTEKTVMRHTPKSEQRLFLASDFVRPMESIVTSVTYHDEKTVFPNYEGVAFWQSFDSPLTINVSPAEVASGAATVGNPVSKENIIGVLLDREAAGITRVNEWSATTPFDARHGIYNQYWHWTERYWNDFSENCVVFYME